MVVTFVLLSYLAIASPRKMSGWDFPRRQTETTGKTRILLTTTRYSQLTNLFRSFSILERSIFWLYLVLWWWSSGGKGRWHQLFFSSRFFLLYRNRVTFSRLLVKKLVAKRMGGRRRKKRSKRRKMGVLLWSMSVNELSPRFRLSPCKFDDRSSSLSPAAQSLDQWRERSKKNSQ